MASTFPTYDISKPDAATQTLTQMGASMRDMETINRAAMVVGTMPGWVMSAPTGGTAPYYTTYVYSRGVERVRQTVAWGVLADGAGYENNPKTIKHEYSNDSGATWASMYSTNGLQSFSYNASGYCQGYTWS